jgi:hypothetical protein
MPKEETIGNHETLNGVIPLLLFCFFDVLLFAGYEFWFAFYLIWTMFGID